MSHTSYCAVFVVKEGKNEKMRRNTIEKNPVRALRIKDLMKEENLTQSQLAEKLNMTQQNLSRILTSQKISDVLMKEICEAFPNYSPDWLMGEDVKIIQRITGELKKNRLQESGFTQLAQYLGYSISLTEDKTQISIQKDDQVKILSPRAYNTLQKDICDYLDYKLSKLF